MSKKENEEKVAFTQKMAEKALGEQMEQGISQLTEDSDFTDEQIGKVKVWMKQIYQLGRNHGEMLSIANSLGEDRMNGIASMFDRITEKVAPTGDLKKYKDEAMTYSLLFRHERSISEARLSQIRLLTNERDMGLFCDISAQVPCRDFGLNAVSSM